MSRLPDNIARLQWNNRLKTVALSCIFLLGIAVFSVCLMLMIVIPASFIPDSGLDLAQAAADPKLQIRLARFFFKILFFSLIAAFYFIHRDINRIDEIFSASKLQMRSSDPFYRTLEQKCIERGLKTPELYLFGRNTIDSRLVTAAVAQGMAGKSALMLTQACLQLPQPLQEALAAQAVQRLYTKDTWFLTLFCFLGHFPYHVLGRVNKIGKIVFKLPMKAADLVIAPFRPRILGLRMTRLDMGAVELTKDPESMTKLLQALATLDEAEKYFYAPYLSLFIVRSGRRDKAFTTS